MLDKGKRAKVWLVFVALSNVGIIAYLKIYTQSGQGEYLLGLPEAFVVLVAFVFGVTAVNILFGWYYLGKPNVSEIYTRETEVEPESSIKSSQGLEEP